MFLKSSPLSCPRLTTLTVVERIRPLLLNQMRTGPSSREGFSLGGERIKQCLCQLILRSSHPIRIAFMLVYVYLTPTLLCVRSLILISG
jgi:hypothetical protein